MSSVRHARCGATTEVELPVRPTPIRDTFPDETILNDLLIREQVRRHRALTPNRIAKQLAIDASVGMEHCASFAEPATVSHCVEAVVSIEPFRVQQLEKT